MEWLEIANALGGKAVLGKDVSSGTAFARRVEVGLPINALAHLKEFCQLTDADLSEVIPRQALTNLWSNGQLTAEQSDRVARIAGVYIHAERVLGNRARDWLLTPNATLDHEMPLRLLRTWAGADLVESTLIRIEHGVYE